jgi:hypothetical protein
LAVASSPVFLFLPLQMEVIYWCFDPDDGRVIVATHVAGTCYSGGGDCAVDHADAAAAAVCFENYFYIVRSVFVLCNSARTHLAPLHTLLTTDSRNDWIPRIPEELVP